jgi:hypothetical protein
MVLTKFMGLKDLLMKKIWGGYFGRREKGKIRDGH